MISEWIHNRTANHPKNQSVLNLLDLREQFRKSYKLQRRVLQLLIKNSHPKLTWRNLKSTGKNPDLLQSYSCQLIKIKRMLKKKRHTWQNLKLTMNNMLGSLLRIMMKMEMHLMLFLRIAI